jgi:tRNA-splicing ligase RtcB
MDSEAGQSYFREMDYCVKFAEANRDQMRKRVEQALLDHTAGIRFAEPINIAHNYAAREHHFGKTVYVHRKGATRATTRDTGIIPGSQGNVSFIVSGKSNPDSFHSCSHGAGRKLGRKQAQRQLDLGEERRRLEGKNILHSLRGKHDLDEAPGAYKDIETVIENQRDLIDIVDILQPLAVIKG